ncbi:methenyltetrahydrofolate cyclohydrolase /5,10-methylenetetrahydrofolate dehydrogenase (NADP+) [Streptohalobacillus salinus]|uniref:Bifunctional protein FolD n=1 Tax=Streptohalobacillus salinus TaxID=621096 RepID=A0A2V3WEU7_9BACI|nr:bifunctional methylenetetrahydrofolate dehydrogenase/methenyltetrahydrofolate cyclohydrolase FolD [Streptohalobacillus salinus]PXW91671.1 methenyltetrahydrofolate cyclohydrolase /5,10-methylenetetrahydrofolate dehydrogenase (NADP+) [Streptohalobacillus salinus]
MAAEVIYGDQLAQSLREAMKEEVTALKEEGLQPRLVVVLIGDDPASRSYVSGKQKAADFIGIDSELITLPDSTTEEALLSLISKLNQDQSVNGILVQLPLPKQINEQAIIEAIDPSKDVDGFHPISIGRMLTGQETFLPCTPFGIITMLKSKEIDLEGKHAVIVGRSNIVGKPVGQLLLNEHATVTYTHSRTKDMQALTKKADVLVVAVGRAGMITQEYVKPGAVVIDVGVNRTEAGTLTGDVDFESVREVASYITPVPKGVGPMTITMLMKNTIKACVNQNKK